MAPFVNKPGGSLSLSPVRPLKKNIFAFVSASFLRLETFENFFFSIAFTETKKGPFLVERLKRAKTDLAKKKRKKNEALD